MEKGIANANANAIENENNVFCTLILEKFKNKTQNKNKTRFLNNFILLVNYFIYKILN